MHRTLQNTPNGICSSVSTTRQARQQTIRRTPLLHSSHDELDKCCLRVVLVEGTFNFKVHIFETGSKHAPALYRPDYDVSNIRRRRNATAIPHLGNWQAKVLMEL